MLAMVNTPGGVAPVEIREFEEPSPNLDEAIVEVRAFSLNRGELSLTEIRPEGWRPGQDVSGIVVTEAADGSGPPVGSRVAGLVDEAGWAQRVAVPISHLAVLPDEVSFAAASALPIAGLTALRALRVGGDLLGRSVLVTGASGGVGRFAVQLAARAGAHVAGVVGSPERGEGLQELGAAEVVTRAEDAEGPFDLILESVGGASLKAAIRLVAPGGTIVVFGNSSGEGADFGFFSFDLAELYPEGARLQLFFFASGTESFGADLARLVALVENDDLSPHVGAEKSWREFGPVANALRERHIVGKAVFRVD